MLSLFNANVYKSNKFFPEQVSVIQRSDIEFNNILCYTYI